MHVDSENDEGKIQSLSDKKIYNVIVFKKFLSARG